jgi:hypothetical protein
VYAKTNRKGAVMAVLNFSEQDLVGNVFDGQNLNGELVPVARTVLRLG